MYFSSVCLDVWISFCLPDRYVRIFSNHTNALWHRATKFGRIARCRPLCPPPQGGKIAVCHVAHRVWYRATKIGALSPHVDRKVLTGRPRPSTTGAEPQGPFFYSLPIQFHTVWRTVSKLRRSKVSRWSTTPIPEGPDSVPQFLDPCVRSHRLMYRDQIWRSNPSRGEGF